MRSFIIPIVPVFLAGPLFADKAEWIGSDPAGTWEDASNWSWDHPANPGISDYPGSATSPGDVNVRIASPNNGDLAVSLSEGLNTATVIRDLRFDAGQEPSVLDVNLLAGSEIIATEVGNTLLTINEGGGNGAGSVARLNIADDLTIGQIRMSRDADGLPSELNILPGGNLNMTGGGHFVMRREVATGTSIFRMTGGAFSSGGNRNLEMGSHNSQVHFSGGAAFDGSNLTLQAHPAGDLHDDKTSVVSVTGSEIKALTIKVVQGWNAASNPDGSSTFSFTSDAGGLLGAVTSGSKRFYRLRSNP